jgi:hypothetical protein
MWIKTEGGYLLNTDQIEYIRYDEETDATYACSHKTGHLISKQDVVDNLFNVLTRGGGQYHVRK